MKVFISTVLFMLLVISCKTAKNISGIYRLHAASRTMLVLHEDHRFEFVKNFAQPGPAFFPDSTELNFRTVGTWQQDQSGRLLLNSFTTNYENAEELVKDSVTRNTDISSFSFWDQYGDPLPIRLIRFPANRTKLHKSNIVSFFAEDFAAYDTMEFHFYGYRPYRWIITPAERMNNHQHRITLYEPFRGGYFKNKTLVPVRKKITDPEKSFALYKSR
ncbi:MAG TPA: hypothetical protein VFX58_17865 [Chitinophagaceae bacterium]|nr:hypothetical protein [Chitinophagaceae bacterium]